MKKMCLLVFLCSCFICASPTIYAQNRPHTLTFTLGGGYDFLAAKRYMENTGIPFFALGYNFTDMWGIEGLLGFFHTDFKRSAHNKKEISGRLFAIDAIFHFEPYKIIEPFFLAGVGAVSLNPNRNDAANEGNINFGFGVQLFADRIVAFRIEARDFYTIVGGKNDVFLDAGVTFLLDLC